MRNRYHAENRRLLESFGCSMETISAAEAVVNAMGDDEAVARLAGRAWTEIPSAEIAQTVAEGLLYGMDHCAVVLNVTGKGGRKDTFLVLPVEDEG